MTITELLIPQGVGTHALLKITRCLKRTLTQREHVERFVEKMSTGTLQIRYATLVRMLFLDAHLVSITLRKCMFSVSNAKKGLLLLR